MAEELRVSTNTLKIPKVDGKDYNQWNFLVNCVLQAKGVLNVDKKQN